jgi:amino acid transporter
MFKKTKIFTTISTILLAFPAYADDVKMVNFNNNTDLTNQTIKIIGNIINLVLGFAGALAALFIVIGGLKLVTSSGNSEKVEKAKKTLTYAVFGVIIVVMVYVILYAIRESLVGLVNSAG